MGRWTDIAQWRGPSPNITKGGMRRWDGVVVHIAAGYYEGTISWQKSSRADVSSHFIVSKSGKIAQMVDTADAAWTQRDGNGEWLSIENEGFLPDKLTGAQIEANAKILAKAHQVYGVPLVVTNTPRNRGLGHHSMGAENGIDWGHSQCPGPNIKAQKPAIVARAKQIVNGDTNMPLSSTELKQIRDQVVLGTYDALWIAAQQQDLPRNKDLSYAGVGKAIRENLGALTIVPVLTAIRAMDTVDEDKLTAALTALVPQVAQAVVALLPDDRDDITIDELTEAFRRLIIPTATTQ